MAALVTPARPLEPGRSGPRRAAVGPNAGLPGSSLSAVKLPAGRAASRPIHAGRAGHLHGASLVQSGCTLARNAFPAIAVATLIPLALFYVTLAAGSMSWAIGISVLYAYGFAAFQYRRRRRVSAMLAMTVFMVTVRAIAAMAAGQAFVYFAIPVAETIGFALMFVATIRTREPLVVRLARDLVPHLADDLAGRRALIRGLSIIWTVTYLASGATTLALLATLPLSVFMGAHQIAGWCWVGGGIALSLSLYRRRDEGATGGNPSETPVALASA